MDELSTIQVAGGDSIPSVGLGLWKIELEKTAATVFDAAVAGYRHLDSACDYGNEAQTGSGIARILSEGVCSRGELWVTSKLWNTYHRPEHVRSACERSLHDLGLDYLDLYLIHFPIALRHVDMDVRYPPGWLYGGDEKAKMELDSVPIAETWGAMEELKESGLVKHIGICNFGTSLIRDLISYARIKPSVLQVESHPYLVQEKLVRYCQQQNIMVTAFSPLGASSYVELGMAQPADRVLDQPVVKEIAKQHAKTPAQVVLRWGLQRGTAVIPKTVRPERLVENIQLFDFSLSEDEMASIAALDRHQRYNDPGVFCESGFGCFCPIYE